MVFNLIYNKVIDFIFGKKALLLEEKLLLAGTVFGFLASIFAASLNAFYSYPWPAILAPFIIGLLLITLYYFIRFRNKYSELFFPVTLLALPGVGIIWIFNGGYDGANTFGMFTIFILVLCVIPFRNSIILLLYYLFLLVLLHFFQLYYPEYIVPYPTDEIRFTDSLITISATTVLVFLMITFLIKNYRDERRISQQQAIKLHELNEVLRVSNQSKDKLLSIMAHDLRSPFAGILGFTELLRYKLQHNDLDDTPEIVDYIDTSAKNTLSLLDNLLEWARLQSGKRNFNPQVFSLREVFSETVSLIEPIAAIKSIRVSYVQKKDIVAYIDHHIVQTILRNLLSNAIKFTAAGGTVLVLVQKNTTEIELSVTDTGIGIDEAVVQLLFASKNGVTTAGTADEKGSGIGLILCKELAELHNGKIFVESKIGVGSKFTIVIPYVEVQ